MKDLWALRIEVARTSKQGAGFEDELKAFSWWFASKKFEDTWSVEQLLQTLRIVKGVDADMLVMERLAELCQRFPSQVIDCLMLMVEGDDEGLGILGWKGEARIALAGALASADREAAKKARELVHKLGGLGYFEFRDLLRDLPEHVTEDTGKGSQLSA